MGRSVRLEGNSLLGAGGGRRGHLLCQLAAGMVASVPQESSGGLEGKERREEGGEERRRGRKGGGKGGGKEGEKRRRGRRGKLASCWFDSWL